MKYEEFVELFVNIHMIFGKNLPSSERLVYYYKELHFIDASASKSIEKYMQEKEAMPSNLLLAIKQAYASYKNSQIKKKAGENCDCDLGMLYAWKYTDVYAYEARCTLACGKCNKGKSDEEYKALGFRLMPRDYKDGVVAYENLHGLDGRSAQKNPIESKIYSRVKAKFAEQSKQENEEPKQKETFLNTLIKDIVQTKVIHTE